MCVMLPLCTYNVEITTKIKQILMDTYLYYVILNIHIKAINCSITQTVTQSAQHYKLQTSI